MKRTNTYLYSDYDAKRPRLMYHEYTYEDGQCTEFKCDVTDRCDGICPDVVAIDVTKSQVDHLQYSGDYNMKRIYNKTGNFVTALTFYDSKLVPEGFFKDPLLEELIAGFRPEQLLSAEMEEEGSCT